MTKLTACLVRILICGLLISAFANATESVPRFGVFETSFTGPAKLDDPYRQVSVSVTFTGPVSAKSPVINIDAFWDGGSTWRVRMSPTEVGQWTWRTTSETKELNNLEGKFPCVPSTGTPFLHIAPGKTNLLMRGDKPFYPLACSGSALSDFNLKDGSFQKFIDARTAQGFNFLYLSWLPSLADDEAGAAFADPKGLIPNPAFFHAADQRMYYCRMKGLVPVIGIGSTMKPHEPQAVERLWRYAVARYAAFDVFWTVSSPIEAPPTTQALGELARKLDPYRHPIMAEIFPGDKAFDNAAWLDVAFLNPASLDKLVTAGKPIITLVPLVENLTGKADPENPRLTVDVDSIRHAAWTAAMHGAYPIYQVAGVDPARPETLNSPAALQAAAIGRFFRQVDWLSMTPSPAILLKGDALVLANPGVDYIVYLPKGGSITLDLSAVKEDKLRVQWFDPRLGKVRSFNEQASEKELTLQAPDDKDDWVVYLSRIRPVPQR